MNIEHMRRHMLQKQAAWWDITPMLRQFFGGATAGADAGKNLALYLLGAAAVGGGAIGAFGANITAHGKQDEDTVKKEYENERLKADIGYVASRLEDEYNRSKTAVKPKAARVLNA